MKKLASLLVLGLICASQGRSSVRVADPRTFPHVAQRARITVLFDGRPLAGARVEVRKYLSSEPLVTLTTNSDAQTALPRLPHGNYQIIATSGRNPETGMGIDICIGGCELNPQILDPTANPRASERRLAAHISTTGVREFSVDVGPFPPSEKLFAAAESQTAVRTLRGLHGVVTDLTGDMIPQAWVGVVRRTKQDYQEVELLLSDNKGMFAAKLPEGSYIVLVSAPGFQVYAMPIAVRSDGEPAALEIKLKIEPAVT